jgi:hypothetical protein
MAVVLLAVTLLAGAACGGADVRTAHPAASASSAPPTTKADPAADLVTAQNLVLKIGDLPAGWTDNPRGPATAETPESSAITQQFASCLGVDPAFLGESGAGSAHVQSDEFTYQQLRVTSEVSIDPTPDAGATAMAIFEKPDTIKCFQQFVNAVETLAVQNDPLSLPPGATMGQVTVERVDEQRFHADAVQLRSTTPINLPDRVLASYIDIVVVVQDRVTLTYSFSSALQTFDPDFELSVVNKSIDRIPG